MRFDQCIRRFDVNLSQLIELCSKYTILFMEFIVLAKSNILDNKLNHKKIFFFKADDKSSASNTAIIEFVLNLGSEK